MYIAVPITAVLSAIITVLIITCIVCTVTRNKAGKTEAASQEENGIMVTSEEQTFKLIEPIK